MRYTRFFFVAIAIFLGIGANLYAADDVVVKTNIPVGTQRFYDVVVTVKSGSSSNADTVLTMKIRHKYIDRSSDGITLMEASLDEGTLTSGEQKLFISPNIYPKLTVVLDPDYRIKDVFGSAGMSEGSNTSCINYSNMIILFYLPDGKKEHAVGESWCSNISIPTPGESFAIVNSLKGIETSGGESIAVVDQKITGKGDPISVESRFGIGDGKLLKSRVSCVVPDRVDPKSKAQITMDITLSK